jgi:D-alanine-D-alanine ligase
LRIGIAFDLAPSGPALREDEGPDDRFEEFDKPETVEAIARVLRDRDHEIILLGDGPKFLRRVLDDPPDLVWNMAEGEGVGRSREARVPAVLEMLGIPYTGSDPLTLAATLDKEVAKRLVSSHGEVAVPRGVALPPRLDERCFRESTSAAWSQIEAKVLLKPSFEGSSKGIRGDCLARNMDDAWVVYQRLSQDYDQTILVEEYIPGEEITVGLLGCGRPEDVEVIGAMRVVPRRAGGDFVYSLEVKRDWRNQVDYEAPAVLDEGTRDRLLAAARSCYARLGCRDVARIDFRLRSGEPYFIEANPLPGLAPVTSDLVILAQGCGLSHTQLIGRILESALTRLGMVEHAELPSMS